jgi:predicted nucleotidyltransferase
MNFVEVLRRVALKLEQSNIPYMVTGSIAASYYGLPRATRDLDIVVSAGPTELKTFVQLLPQEDYYAMLQDALDARRHQSMFNVLDMSTGWKIDFIFKKSAPFHEEAFRRRKAVTFEGVHTSMISGEDLILSKLEWSKMGESERQIKDAAIVLQKRLGELDQNYIQKWVKELGLSTQWERARKLAGLE